MLGTEDLLVDRQRTLEERPRLGQVTLVLKQRSEIAEAGRRIGMLGVEQGLHDFQGLTPQLGCVRISSRHADRVRGGVQPGCIPIDPFGAAQEGCLEQRCNRRIRDLGRRFYTCANREVFEEELNGGSTTVGIERFTNRLGDDVMKRNEPVHGPCHERKARDAVKAVER
jgi:hypothetical protein